MLEENMNQERADQFRNELYGALSNMGKSLSSDRRLEILGLLTHSSKTVEEIASTLGMSVANTSRHLQVLFTGNLVKREKQGNFVVYKLASERVNDLIELLKQVGQEQLAQMTQIEEAFDDESGAKILTLAQAKRMIKSENVQVMDVRPQDEYESGHIHGAVNVPMKELTIDNPLLNKKGPVIVYCRGRFCAYANLATKTLMDAGFDAYSLNSSLYQWNHSQSN